MDLAVAFISIGNAALISALLSALEHWLPWRLITGQDQPSRLAAYGMGTGNILFSFSALLIFWHISSFPPTAPAILASAWLIAAASGISTWLCYRLDKYLDFRARALEAEEREQAERKNKEALYVTTGK